MAIDPPDPDPRAATILTTLARLSIEEDSRREDCIVPRWSGGSAGSSTGFAARRRDLDPEPPQRPQATSAAGKTGPSTQTRRRSSDPSGWRIGATQLKQAPKPQAMWFSRERSQATWWRSTSLESAASIAGGPQPTTFAGR